MYSDRSGWPLAPATSLFDLTTTAPTPLSSARSIPLRSMTCSAGPAMIGFFKVTPPTVVERSIPIASGPTGYGCSGLPRNKTIVEIVRDVLCHSIDGLDHREVLREP